MPAMWPCRREASRAAATWELEPRRVATEAPPSSMEPGPRGRIRGAARRGPAASSSARRPWPWPWPGVAKRFARKEGAERIAADSRESKESEEADARGGRGRRHTGARARAASRSAPGGTRRSHPPSRAPGPVDDDEDLEEPAVPEYLIAEGVNAKPAGGPRSWRWDAVVEAPTRGADPRAIRCGRGTRRRASPSRLPAAGKLRGPRPGTSTRRPRRSQPHRPGGAPGSRRSQRSRPVPPGSATRASRLGRRAVERGAAGDRGHAARSAQLSACSRASARRAGRRSRAGLGGRDGRCRGDHRRRQAAVSSRSTEGTEGHGGGEAGLPHGLRDHAARRADCIRTRASGSTTRRRLGAAGTPSRAA